MVCNRIIHKPQNGEDRGPKGGSVGSTVSQQELTTVQTEGLLTFKTFLSLVLQDSRVGLRTDHTGHDESGW